MICLMIVWITSAVRAVESPYDSYEHATECPANGPAYATDPFTSDSRDFVRCQCTSYVSSKLSALFTARYYNNGAPAGLVRSFQNLGYYMPQGTRTRWSNARYWRDAAIFAGIGVTGAQDNFTWDTASYNAAFPGDVAWWDRWNSTTGKYGHVAVVESATPGPGNIGVGCVTLTEYNWSPAYEFNRRTLCRNADGSFPSGFPDAFLHIDKDHAYCVAHSTTDNCTALWGGQMVASSGMKADGLGGGSDTFNLKVNSFGTWDAAGVQLTPDVSKVTTGQVVTVKVQVKAKDGNTSTHMRPGKSRIEVDIYVRQDTGDWVFLKREYIQAVNLPSGATHTESITYTIPPGVSEVSFKAKIDAQDEAYEANEGDNWTEIQTFQVDFSWLIPILNLLLND